jgi:hypothetical protein
MSIATSKLITKIFVSGAIVLGIGIGAAASASADPISFGTDQNPFHGLTCNCQPQAPLTGTALTQELNRGIRAGLPAS